MPVRLTRTGVKKTTFRTKCEKELPEARAVQFFKARRLHRVETRHENLDAGVADESDCVSLQRDCGLVGAGRGEIAVLVDELDDRLRDGGESYGRGQREIKAETEGFLHGFSECLEIIERVLARDGGQRHRRDGDTEDANG